MPPNPNLPAFEKFGRFIDPSEDPTKSKGLRRRFTAAATRRWVPSKQYVREQVITNDVFGLNGGGNPVLTDAQRMDRFMMGFEQVQAQSILERARGTIPWITPFVREAFIKGMVRGNRDLAALARGQRRERAKAIKRAVGNAAAYRVNQTAEDLFIAPTLDPDNLQDALQAGERARLFELEVTRTWQGITGVTAQVNAQVAAVIADGLEARSTPRQLAKDINARIDAVGITRSQMIARTETVAANNRGAVAEFAEAERLTGFDVLVQWETALDSRVRDTHIVRHGDVYTKEAGLSLIGEPNCLLPDAMVFSPSPIVRVYKHSYQGPIVTLTTLDGHKITCTPNHPLLTPGGFKPAGKFVEGESNYILTTYDEGAKNIKDVYIDFAEGMAELDALQTEQHHFHGDGQPGGTAIVLTDPSLATREHVMLKRDKTETSLFSSVNQDHVVKVEWGEHFGYVYNLETVSGNYSAGGVLSSNCRCALLPYIPAIEGDVDLSSGKAAKALTPDEAKARAERERKKLDVPKGQEGKPVKRRKRKG